MEEMGEEMDEMGWLRKGDVVCKWRRWGVRWRRWGGY